MSKSRPLSKKTSLGSRQHQGRFFIGLVVVGLLMFGVATYRKQAYYAALTPDLEVNATEVEQAVVPVRIHVGAMVDTPVVTGEIVDGEWQVADDAAVYLAGSGGMNGGGNMIVYGHNTAEILGNIRAFTGREQITLSMSDGSSKVYEIASMHEVEADDLALLQSTEEEVLTVYTCSGFLDQKRFVVRARLLEQG